MIPPEYAFDGLLDTPPAATKPGAISGELKKLRDELFGTPAVEPNEFTKKFGDNIGQANTVIGLIVRDNPDIRSRATLADYLADNAPKARPYSESLFSGVRMFADVDESGSAADWQALYAAIDKAGSEEPTAPANANQQIRDLILSDDNRHAKSIKSESAPKPPAKPAKFSQELKDQARDAFDGLLGPPETTRSAQEDAKPDDLADPTINLKGRADKMEAACKALESAFVQERSPSKSDSELTLFDDTPKFHQEGLPRQYLSAAMQFAVAMATGGANQADDLAGFLDRRFEKQGRRFSQALWSAMGAVDPALVSVPNWAAIYRKVDRDAARCSEERGKILSARFVRRIVRGLQSMNDSSMLLSGDGSTLINVWDEICVQQQSEESFAWPAYVQTIEAFIAGDLEGIAHADLTALWLDTETGSDWSIDCKPGEIPSPCEVDVATMLFDKVLRAADDYTNARIRAYLDRPYRD